MRTPEYFKRPSQVDRLITFDLLNANGLVYQQSLTKLRYAAKDPHAIQLSFGINTGKIVTWIVSRELWIHGLRTKPGEYVGKGDFIIGTSVIIDDKGRDASAYDPYSREKAFIALTSPDGYGILQTDKSPLQQFLRSTQHVVPFGSEREYLNMDVAIQKLSGGK